MPKESLTIYTVDKIQDATENYFACMILQSLIDFYLYHEPEKLTHPQTMKHTLPDFSLVPQLETNHTTKVVYIEIAKSRLTGGRKENQRKIAYGWLKDHPEADYLQLCQPILQEKNYVLSIIEQVAYDQLTSNQAQEKVANFIKNPNQSLRSQSIHFVY